MRELDMNAVNATHLRMVM